ncbi:MAG TPA: hypothetical protein ENI23_02920 [bacterium]|nr:hypothetical protein [bacterium]
MSGYHKCIACPTWITYRFAICAKCEQEYGRSAREWPKWLRFLWNDIQKERRRTKRIREHEITFSELEDKNRNE